MNTNVSNADLKLILESYTLWKKLNANLIKFASRSVNIPEAISESLCCYQLGYIWHNKTTVKKAGDATGPNNKLIEIKATSNFHKDLTSFSPKTHFDILIFARFKLLTDELYIYNMDMNYSQLQEVKVNKTQNVLNQQKQGKRPRLSLVKLIDDGSILIDKRNIHVLDLKKLASNIVL